MGIQCPAAFAARKLAAGTVFLQQSSGFAEGTHLPFRQQSIASRVRALAKQSNGRASNTIASRLTTIWTPRLISIFQPTINLDAPGLIFVSIFMAKSVLDIA